MTPRWRIGAALAAAVALLSVLLPAVVAPATAATPDRLHAFGQAVDLGVPDATGDRRLVAVVGHGSGGYWVASSDGGVYSYGGAPFHGSLGGQRLDQPVVGMVSSPSGRGYYLVAGDGGVFTFGDAQFQGSLGGQRLNAPIVGMAVTATNRGYWLVARDGGVFTFGDAPFLGSAGGTALNAPIVGMAAAHPAGRGPGYWLAAADGGVFTYGDVRFHGSAGALPLRSPVTAITASPSGAGYWLAAGDGGVFTYGDAPYLGSAAGEAAAEPVVDMARLGTRGYWLLRSPERPPYLGPPLPAGSGTGRRIVYSNPGQRVWIVGGDGYVEGSWAVSGRRGVPRGGTYRVFSKSRYTSAGHDGITMEYMVRFAHGDRLAIGFHAIPRDRYGRPIQSEHDLGGYRSAGCVRQADRDAARLWDWAPVGTTVVVVY